MNIKGKTLLILILTSLWLPLAQAQTEVITAKYKYESRKECSSDSGTTFLTYHIRPDIMRLDFNGPSSNSSIIYQPASQKIWVLYRHEKVYYIMTAEDIKLLEDQIKTAGEEMIRSQQNMSDQDKKSMEVLWANGNPFELDEPVYVQVKKKDSLVSQLMCKRYDGQLKNGTVKRAYTNNLKSTGFKDDQLAILNSFCDFMGDGTRVLAGNMDFVSFRKWDIGAYPILVENRAGKVLCSSLLLQEIYHMNRKDEFFVIPNGFGVIDNPVGISH
ncbi:MAG TPA: hypothetical protein DCX54_06635 [Flavobacteriales bacterium]|nr:hypothetical protein [Flavobacteriales bacterium]